MKKLLLVVLAFFTLSFGMNVNAQTFVRHYNNVIKRDKATNKLGEWEETNLNVIFSGNAKGDIIFYYDLGEVERYYKITEIFHGVTTNDLKYRYITTINEKKDTVMMQLYDNGVFRVHHKKFILEYHTED
jgi:hypothetical protein